MIVAAFAGKTPRVASSALVADTACLIGDVEVGENTSIWPGVVIRADIAPIRVGSNCHIEDNSVLHGRASVGDNSMIGHNCVVEGRVGSNTLISNSASVLFGAEVGNFCLVAANAVVMEGAKIPDRSFVAGTPGVVKGEITQRNIEAMNFYMPYYVQLAQEYKRQGVWRR